MRSPTIASSELSFPTANVDISQQYLPLAGVFACIVQLEKETQRYPAVCNIGFAPTFGQVTDESARVEVHILDFDKSIYGRNLEITFISFLRDEKKFENIEELAEQISKDENSARNWLLNSK